jgi:hypothetical protein
VTDTPVATNWGNVGGLNLPHKLIIFPENGNYYGLTENVNDDTLTRLSFGPDFTASPTGVNLGNIGGLNHPCGLTYVKSGGNPEELDVFNRWGGMVFSTRNPSDCWNGATNGVAQPAGAYTYVIKAKTPCGEVTRTGFGMLIR